MKIMVKSVGVDAIYATNANRKYVIKNKIKTDFRLKGVKPKDYKEQQK